MGANHLRHAHEDLRQTLRVVLRVDVFDIILLLALRFCVTNIVDIEAQRLRQIIEPV